MIKLMDFVYTQEKTGRDLKANGQKVWSKDMESIIGLMENDMKDNIS